MDSFCHGYDSCYHVIQSIIDLIHFITAINMLNEIIFFIDNKRFSLVCFIIYKRERTHFISIYCIQLKGFTLSWMGFILSWYSIRYRSDSFYHSNKPVESNHFFIIILIKIITEGFSLVCFIICKREDSFYHDLVHKIEGIHFIMDGIHFIMVFISLLNGFILS